MSKEVTKSSSGSSDDKKLSEEEGGSNEVKNSLKYEEKVRR